MRVLLLDGHNLMYRAFTSLPRSITGRNDEPINGVYGMLSAVQRLARDLAATHAVAAFDTPDVPTFRHALYPDYQAQRGPLGGEHADDFSRQVRIAQEVLRALNVPALTYPEYEADDIMGTLAVRIAAVGGQAIIVSTDRDLLQLVRPGVAVFSPGNPPKTAWDELEVHARLGVHPGGVTTWKALAGDPSDNIPGVTGIGTKGAAQLVEQYGTLEEIYGALESLPARTARALAAGRDDAYLFQTVVTVVTDVPVGIDIGDLPALAPLQAEGPRAILNRLGYGKEESGTPGGIRTPGL